MMERLGPQSVVVRVSDVKSAPVDGDLVILNLAKGSYVGLDEIGRQIWTLLESPARVDVLCGLLARGYAGNPAQVAQDVTDFLNELHAEGLITVAQVVGEENAGVSQTAERR